MSKELKLNDPVKVAQKNDSPLQGIVAYLGSVEFADGEDWVGIRLTGDSVDKGKNDGSIQGKVYFKTSHEKGGVFVRRANVSPWVLTKLEELRLKREIQGILPTMISRSPSTKTISSKDDDESSVSSLKSSATGMSGKSRLEEIRARRMALQQQQKSHLTASSPATKNILESKILPKTMSPSPFKNDSVDPNNIMTITNTKSNLRGPITPPRDGPIRTPASRRASPTSSKKVISSLTEKNFELPVKQENSNIMNEPKILQERLDEKLPVEQENSNIMNEPNILQERLDEMSILLKERDETMKCNTQELERLTEVVQKMSFELNLKAKENEELQSSLKMSEDRLHKVNRDYDDTKSAMLLAQQDVDEGTTQDSKCTSRRDQDSSIYLREIENLQQNLVKLQNEKESLRKEVSRMEERLHDTERQNESLQEISNREKEKQINEFHALQQELSDTRSEISSLKKDILSQKEEKIAVLEETGASNYKERATIHAEIVSLQRRLQEAKQEKQDLEKTVEDLVLDKDALQEKLEALEDKYEELKIDAESAQIEVDELRLELEDANAFRVGAEAKFVLNAASSEAKQRGDHDIQADDAAHVLSVQNVRLREAILRLREQSNADKIDLTKQIRSMERDIEEAKNTVEELKELRKKEAIMKEEIRDLKDMVDQGAAFEEMVEQMSERVIAVEENNINLQKIIQELEEASELSAEMEEAQSEEIKSLLLDLQSRDATIANFEEAIKMQRHRELDYQRTVTNYKALIETMQRERDSLISEIGTRDGIQNDVILSSQKALSQAAQSITDAANAREKEAEYSFHLIDAKVKSHLADRLEDFLPKDLTSSEITAVKGELLLSKVAMKASLCLSSISDVFEKVISQARNLLLDSTTVTGVVKNEKFSFNLINKIATLVHETKFAQVALDIFGTTMNLLVIGQWPGVISAKASAVLGCFVSHSVSSLDSSISVVLSTLKKEGGLSPHQANLNLLTQSIAALRLTMHDCVDDYGKLIVPSEWSLPCLDALNALSSSKFFCYGATSILCSILMDESSGPEHVSDSLIGMAMKMEKICKEIKALSSSLSAFDISDTQSVQELYELTSSSKECFRDLFDEVESTCKKDEISIESIEKILSIAEIAFGYVVKLNSFIRTRNIARNNENQSFHLLSPETQDPWFGVINEAKRLSDTKAALDDVNYMVRGREIKNRLNVAMENDTKLLHANEKICYLERTLSTRLREISIQNSRLEELENLITQSNQSARIVNSPSRTPSSTDEVQALKDELKSLTETIDVLQSQVNEYEKEIRLLKDLKMKTTRRKGASFDPTMEFGSPNNKVSSLEAISSSKESLYLETSIFRPALREALSEASMWKAKRINEKLSSLPSLKESEPAPLSNERKQLALARADYRKAKTNIKIISLKNVPIDSHSLAGIVTNHKFNTMAAVKRCELISNSLEFRMTSKNVLLT